MSHNAYPAYEGETMVSMKSLIAGLLLAALLLSGCAGGKGSDDKKADELADGAPEIEVTETTGGIRGVVVDDAIRPIKGATVEVLGTDKSMVTDDTGLFAFSGLNAGTYFVKASQALYDQAQQSVEVVAGVADPVPVKFLLTRVILANPYMTTEKFDGFIACSAGHAEVGYSEECGEGVGSPADSCFIINHPPSCVPNPVMPGERIGGQDNNHVQYDFTIENHEVKTIVVELSWKPTSEAGQELLTYVSTNWLCDPFCGGNVFVDAGGPSPLILRADNATLEGMIAEGTMNTTAPITVFTWANPYASDPVTHTAPMATVVLNQGYQLFVSKSYYLPLPEAWSFVQGSPNPFV